MIGILMFDWVICDVDVFFNYLVSCLEVIGDCFGVCGYCIGG